MFGKRGNEGFGKSGSVAPPPSAAPSASAAPVAARSAAPEILAEPLRDTVAQRQQISSPPPLAPQSTARKRPARTELYYDTKSQVFSALIDTIDLSQLAKLDAESAREEIRDIVNDIITIKNFAMSISEQEELLEDICNDVLGYGPLEPLLARDDISDIMVNGAGQTFIEVAGKTIESEIRFRDNSRLLSICQRIVSQVGRRVDESSPICDARLPDGSRVNVIAPPLAIDGPALTIRKFKKDKLNLDQARQVRRHHPGRRHPSADHRPRPLQHRHLRRYRFRQDHASELPDQLYRQGRAGHHLRGHRRTAAAAAACGPPGNPPAEHRRRGRDHHA